MILVEAVAVAQRKSVCLIKEKLWVRFPPGAGLFSSSILSNVSLNRSLKEVQHYCFANKKMNVKQCSSRRNKLNKHS